ncbi:MAG: protein kinase [Spirosomataceae bacterium]
MSVDLMIGKRFLSYTLRQDLGEGGMASVYLADNTLGKKFAVKVLRPELFGKEILRQRFRNEAQVMVSLEHPNIRQVIDWYEEGTFMAIVLEYLNGNDLQRIIDQNGRVAEKQVVEWYNQILPAFSYTHQQGVVHRDVKPSNFFLTNQNILKVLDYGIAKIRDYQVTQELSTLGSPLYMSPEQVKSPKNVTHLTDIYSLGVMLWVFLAGKKPYDENIDSLYEIQGKIVKEPLPNLPTVSAKLNQLIQKATAKHPEDRFQSADEFLKALNSSHSTKSEATLPDQAQKTTIRNSEGTIPDRPKKTPVQKPAEKPSVQLPPPKRSFMRLLTIFLAGAGGMLLLLYWLGTRSKDNKTAIDSNEPLVTNITQNTIATQTSMDTSYFHTQKVAYQSQGNWVGALVEGYATFSAKDNTGHVVYGFVNSNFQQVIPAVYENLGNFRDGAAPVLYGGKWGVISPENKMLADFQFDKLSEFNQDGYAYAEKAGKAFYINKNGACVSYNGYTCY